MGEHGMLLFVFQVRIIQGLNDEMPFTLSPPANKGLLDINRDLFRRTLNLVALRIAPSKCRQAMNALRGGTLLNVPRLPTIIEDPQDVAQGKPNKSAKRLVLLSPDVAPSKTQLPPEAAQFVAEAEAEVTDYTLEVGYDYWTADQVLSAILPDDMEVPGAFESVGHIAHLNLRDHHLPFKKIIGQVILDKNVRLRTVVNKLETIDHTFRFFKMDVIAGEDDMMAELHESNCKFRFDYSKVYWNSRLQGEHDRIVNLFSKGQLICDVFAGIGPYALPAAKNKESVVFANDLNPSSYEYLCKNATLNKLEHLVRPYNMDGRNFIRSSLVDLNTPEVWETLKAKAPAQKGGRRAKEDGSVQVVNQTSKAPKTPAWHKLLYPDEPKSFRWFNHYIMNLPATAIVFLDAFRGLFHGKADVVPVDQLPLIHCHCFSRAEDLTKDVIQRVEAVLKAPLGDNVVTVYNVRNVAPNKQMMCISFRLPAEVAFAEPDASR
ncbi:guanine(37)-N1-methyltransferase [Gaertneriomyces semiglobifer]|nr:guanine(37)-N1-methyltransferase [Gaertneriomyces semiglobifer]